MRCPFCGYDDSKVIDSRTLSEGMAIRRRRECTACKKRFTTYERVEEIPMMVIKKDGGREEFNSEKIFRGLIRATEKRNISREILEALLLDIEREVEKLSLKGEISSKQIGEIVVDNLKNVDEVACIRFASVYRDFKDLESFMFEISKLKRKEWLICT